MFNSVQKAHPLLRRVASYPEPRYVDPNDTRFVKIVKGSDDSKPKAVNILGVPFDGAVLGRKGAAGGPAALRQSLAAFSNYNIELGVGLRGARVYDIGDAEVTQDDVRGAHREIEKVVSQSLRPESLLTIIGGDNSVSLPALSAYATKFGKIGLVVIDSHMDLRGEIDGEPTSGSSYGLAMESLPGLRGSRVAEIGVHGFLNSETYYRKSRNLGVSIFTAADVRKQGPAKVADRALAKAAKGAKAVYLSVDIDSVDIGWVSGVSAPSAGGINPQELFDMVYRIAKSPLVKCADIVELAPSLDPTGRSQVVAATVLTNIVAGFASRED